MAKQFCWILILTSLQLFVTEHTLVIRKVQGILVMLISENHTVDRKKYTSVNHLPFVLHLLIYPVLQILKPNYIFIADRCFHDTVNFLEEQHFQVLMPALKGNHRQLTQQEANESKKMRLLL